VGDFYTALQRHNGAAPLAGFVTAINSLPRDQDLKIITGVLSDKSKRSQKSPQPSIAQAAKS